MNFYKMNRKLKNARENGFNFNQINKLTMKFYSILSNKRIKKDVRNVIISIFVIQ